MGSCFKPWGNIDWLLKKTSNMERWGYLGCISTEDRSTCALEWLDQHDALNVCEMWKIEDVPRLSDNPHKVKNEEKYKVQIEKYKAIANEDPAIFGLFQSDECASSKFSAFVKKTDGNIIFDVSSMPKRWFFPIIRTCLQSEEVKNLLVTYTIAKTYSSVQGEDPLGWKYIPSFGEAVECGSKEKYYIISAGFQPLSLPKWIEGFPDSKIYILFPFPSDVSGYYRVWDFIRAIETEGGTVTTKNIEYISGYNLPLIYNSLRELIALEHNKQPVFVPYGPKPISLACALLASQLKIPVGYTQPTYYNPDYSTGVDMCPNGEPRILAYLIKKDGNTLYVPPKLDL